MSRPSRLVTGGEAAAEEREGVGRQRDGGGRPEGQRHRRVDVGVRRGADGGGEVGGGQSAPCSPRSHRLGSIGKPRAEQGAGRRSACPSAAAAPTAATALGAFSRRGAAPRRRRPLPLREDRRRGSAASGTSWRPRDEDGERRCGEREVGEKGKSIVCWRQHFLPSLRSTVHAMQNSFCL